METPLIKEFITRIPHLEQSDAKVKETLERAAGIAVQEDKDLGTELNVPPVRHTIKIEAVK